MPTQPKPKPRSVGRPKLAEGQAKGTIVPVRFSPEDRAALEQVATSEGISVSEFVRKTVRAAIFVQPKAEFQTAVK